MATKATKPTKTTKPTKPTSKQMTPLIQSDKQAPLLAQRAIMEARLRRGIISEDFKNAAPVTAVGTPEELEALRVKWGLE